MNLMFWGVSTWWLVLMTLGSFWPSISEINAGTIVAP